MLSSSWYVACALYQCRMACQIRCSSSTVQSHVCTAALDDVFQACVPKKRVSLTKLCSQCTVWFHRCSSSRKVAAQSLLAVSRVIIHHIFSFSSICRVKSLKAWVVFFHQSLSATDALSHHVLNNLLIFRENMFCTIQPLPNIPRFVFRHIFCMDPPRPHVVSQVSQVIHEIVVPILFRFNPSSV